MITGLAHVALVASDMRKSLDFYCGALGLTHAFSIPREDGTPWIEYLKICPGQFLELFYAEPGHVPAGRSHAHLCLQVDDVRAAAAALEAAGIALRDVPRQGRDKNWQCWVDDPDGHRIELMQIDPASPQALA